MKRKLIKFIALTVISALLFLLLPPAPIVDAAPLTDKSDTMTSLKISTASDHTIQFTTPTGVAATETITVDFATGFNLTSVVIGDVDLEDDTVDLTLAATCSGTTWGYVLSGQVITFTSCTGTIAAASVVAVKIGTVADGGSNQITNPGTSGSKTIAIAGTMVDSGDIVVQILDDDQVTVSATVDESLSFSISDNAIGFGTLSSSAARYATGTTGSDSEVEAHTLTAGTNATSGYVITVNGVTLTFGGSTITAIGATNTASATGTEQFGLRINITSGDGTATAPYAAAGFALDTVVFPDEVGSYTTGPSGDTIYSVRYIANIATDTDAGSYTATLTYTATGTF